MISMGKLFISNKNVVQPPEMFYKKAVLKNFAIFPGKNLCWGVFLIKLQAFRENFSSFLNGFQLSEIAPDPRADF